MASILPKFTLFALLFAFAFASPAAAATHRHATLITLATIAGYASQVAGQPVGIVCEAPDVTPDGMSASPPPDGWVNFDGSTPVPVIHLRDRICTDLEHAITGWAIYPRDFLTLEHEAQHIALASLDECLVDQTALGNVWQIVHLFKLPAWRSQAILDNVAHDDALLPANYHPDAAGGC